MSQSGDPLESGHRLVLRYSLEHQRDGTVCSKLSRSEEISKLKSIIPQCNAFGSILKSYYGSDDYSRESSLSYESLEQEDRELVSKIKEACDGSTCSVFLVNLDSCIAEERDKSDLDSEYGYDGYDGYDLRVLEDKHKLADIIDADGHKLFSAVDEVNIDLGVIIQWAFFDGEKPNTELDCDSHNGRYIYHVYQRTVRKDGDQLRA